MWSPTILKTLCGNKPQQAKALSSGVRNVHCLMYLLQIANLVRIWAFYMASKKWIWESHATYPPFSIPRCKFLITDFAGTSIYVLEGRWGRNTIMLFWQKPHTWVLHGNYIKNLILFFHSFSKLNLLLWNAFMAVSLECSSVATPHVEQSELRLPHPGIWECESLPLLQAINELMNKEFGYASMVNFLLWKFFKLGRNRT